MRCPALQRGKRLRQSVRTVAEWIDRWQAHFGLDLLAIRQRFVIRQMLRVDGDTRNRAARICDLRQRQRQISDLLDAGQLVIRQTTHVRARRLMTNNQRIRLTAVDQRQRHTGIADMAQAALPFDDVPVIIVVVWR